MFNGITIEPKYTSIAFAFCYHGRESEAIPMRGPYSADSVRLVSAMPVVVASN